MASRWAAGRSLRSWRYNQLSIAGPSTTLTYDDVPAASVLHFQYASDPASPWRGVGPLQVAALAGRLSAETIAALADESSGPRGSFLPLPETGSDDTDDTTLDLLKADIKTANGGMLTVETTADDWRQGGNGAANSTGRPNGSGRRRRLAWLNC